MIPHGPPTRQQWRYSRFMEHYEHFRTRQLQQGDWVPFNRIADWMGREEGTGRIDDSRVTETYRDLLKGLRHGAFDRDGRCTVYYLWFDETEYEARRAGSWLIGAVDEILGEGADFRKGVVGAYLMPCWVPRDVLLKWCENNKITPRPGWIESLKTIAQPAKTSPPGKKRQAIDEAVCALWPDGNRPVLAEVRNAEIKAFIKKNKPSLVPITKTIERYFSNRVCDN